MAETKRVFLVIDAGGTSTRAVIVDSSGRCLGYGRAGGGNPTSAGITSAVAAVGLASEQARAGSDITGGPPHLVVIALAGENTAAFREQVSARLAPLGFGPVIVEPDLLGMFHSGTHLPRRVCPGRWYRGRGCPRGGRGVGPRSRWQGMATRRRRQRVLDRSSGCPSGGRRARRSRSGNGLDRTSYWKTVSISRAADSPAGRAQALKQLVSILYSWRPVQLSEFAPLAFGVHEDPVARGILVAASAALAELLSAVRAPNLAGPVIAGGGVLIGGFLAAPPALREQLCCRPITLGSFRLLMAWSERPSSP